MKYYLQTKKRKASKKVCLLLKKKSRDLLYESVLPLLEELHNVLDIRLVRTFYQLLETILSFRHSRNGLLLTELGAGLMGADQAPAGVKRISNLLRSVKWSYQVIGDFLVRRACQHLQVFDQTKADLPLLLWDDSVVEKHESIRLDGLCAVRSSKFKRLVRIKPGFYNPPTKKPAFVPGLQWCALCLMGLRVRPEVFAFEFWSQRKRPVTRKDIHLKLLAKSIRYFGDAIVHVFDRGFASVSWLAVLVKNNQRFILRWPSRYRLAGPNGQIRKAYLWSVGRKAISHRRIYDTHTGNYRKAAVLWTKVRHPKLTDQPLYLIICRPGKKARQPWYLLTTEKVEHAKAAWKIVFAYARRWQIEMTFRFNKTELGIESPRLWFEENRLKLLMILALIYSYLLSMLDKKYAAFVEQLLRYGCHRTGKRCKNALTPLYRIRIAIANMICLPDQNSG